MYLFRGLKISKQRSSEVSGDLFLLFFQLIHTKTKIFTCTK
ncbi:hypothetical protein MCC93_12740 [Morococcus cerebrosus]|uniref:Uncharacterized protein n=1 Tax=Morococcus cerebrosus TaxID=1056807 RepID=A0A0C1E7J4_9NEIS|nr:hypothetical protein MCC93_12740 [Morococcus cerebrosus]